MLSALSFVASDQAERALKADKKARKKEQKRQRKDRKKQSKLSTAQQDGDAHAHAAGASSASDSDAAAEPAGPSETSAPGAAREDWMTKAMPRSAPAAPGSALEPPTEDTKPSVSARELNPYFGEGGDGKPPEAVTDRQGAVPAGGVGDGGASWRMKALRRAQAVAAEDGRAVSEVVSERWGSLSTLTATLTAGRAAHAMAHSHAARDRRGGEPAGGRGRGRADGADHAGPRQPQGGREGPRGGEDGERGRGGDRPRAERAGSGAGYLDDVRTGRSQMRRPSDAARLSWRRGADGTKEAGSRGGGPGGAARRGAGRADPLGRAADAAVLRAAAADLNTFAADGSFMESFVARAAAAAGAAPAEEGPGGEGSAEGSVDPRPADPALGPAAGGGSSAADAGGDAAAEEGAAEAAPGQAPACGLTAAQVALLEDDADEEGGSCRAAAPPPRAADAAGPGGGRGDGGAAAQAAAAAAAPAPAPARAPPPGGRNFSAAAALRARLLGAGAAGAGAAGSSAPGAHEPGGAAAAGAGGSSGGGGSRRARESVALPMVDAAGRAVRGAFGREAANAGAPLPGKRPKRLQGYEGGERARYFADDDAPDLAALVKRQRHEGAPDLDANLADSILRKGARFRERDLHVDEEYDHDAQLGMYEGRAARGTAEQRARRDKAAQVADFRKTSGAQARCGLCFSSAARPRQLTIAIGHTAYLALPAGGCLVPGHCLIVPMEHVASCRQADEQVWTELRNFKKCLVQMYAAQGQEALFMETALALGDVRSHAAVEALPLPPKAASKAAMYFKKGIDDAASEWAQHHAKRWLDTTGKGLRGSIPPSFPYFALERGLAAGHVHVIDDEADFPRGFGRGILVGLLGLPPEAAHQTLRAPGRAGPTGAQAAEFRKQFQPFDWTAQLE